MFLMSVKNYGFTVKTGQNVNRKKTYLVESQFVIKLMAMKLDVISK